MGDCLGRALCRGDEAVSKSMRCAAACRGVAAPRLPRAAPIFVILLYDSTSQSRLISMPNHRSSEPKKKLGMYWMTGKGRANMAYSAAATTMPFQRLNTPARIVKMVWLQCTELKSTVCGTSLEQQSERCGKPAADGKAGGNQGPVPAPAHPPHLKI